MDEHEDKSEKQEYEYRRKGSEDIAYPITYIAGGGRGGFGGAQCVSLPAVRSLESRFDAVPAEASAEGRGCPT